MIDELINYKVMLMNQADNKLMVDLFRKINYDAT